ncbi:hypothetical protein OG921_25700 [Aldersonia sp. NBC_00410]|uniref:hypothetical protein n=1 Tax=Aldersonia sp. NBC_00410 TaxID=2975954 RepID=UPI002256FFD2|nr:hypothetical protein [Aldersonia sp. NBC_00410]MCX5046571.1 hypothetical protein [Aldersonia sp. NBC_00410]
MKTSINRSVRISAATVVAAGAILGLAQAPAGAAVDNGQRTGPVQFWATDKGGCKAEFNILNSTNVTTYTIDWRIDDEAGRDIGVGFDVWRTGTPNMASKAASPTWPDEVPENTVDNRTMVSDRDPVLATYVQDLKNINASWNPALPNPDANTHKVDYRIVLGPPGNNGQTPDEKPEWLGDRAWHTVTVTGCNPSTPSTGSADLLPSLFR